MQRYQRLDLSDTLPTNRLRSTSNIGHPQAPRTPAQADSIAAVKFAESYPQ